MIGKIKEFNFKSLLIFNTFALIATCFFFNNFIFIGVFAIFFFISLFSTKNGLEIIRKLNLLQNIRTEGPSNHYKKSDTPTMGGVFLIIPFLIFLLIITINLGSLKLFLLFLTIFGFFITGFLDDYLSIKNKKNTGLKTKEKFILQSIISIIFILLYFSHKIFFARLEYGQYVAEKITQSCSLVKFPIFFSNCTNLYIYFIKRKNFGN